MLLNLLRRTFSISPSTASRTYVSGSSYPSTSSAGGCRQPDVQQFTFSEEPLGLPASEGFGYFQGGPGDVLGPNNRFKLAAKLGFGTVSSVWLARDHSTGAHVAIKILNGNATRLNRERKLRELEVLNHISSASRGESSPHLAGMVTNFYHQGIESDGEHLCLVMTLLGPSIQDARSALEGEHIPVPTVKRILMHMLLGITALHDRGVAHTDLKPDNMMVDLHSKLTPDAIDSWIENNPPRTYSPEQSLQKMVTAFVSQSLPIPPLDALSSSNFRLADFSSAQFVNDQTTDDITPLSLRPPEVILGAEWDQSVDIWTFGCMVYALLTNGNLFSAVPWKEKDASETEYLLFQMIMFCGEFFTGPFLRRCPLSLDYFELDCRPKKFTKFVHKPFQACILEGRHLINTEDVEGAAALMGRCLRLDPKDRATARELLGDPWLNS